MKAVILVDMTDDVSLDEWFAVEVTVDRLKATEEEMLKGIPFDESKTFKFVPLRPLPNKQETARDEAYSVEDYRIGYNACLDAIMGETE